MEMFEEICTEFSTCIYVGKFTKVSLTVTWILSGFPFHWISGDELMFILPWETDVGVFNSFLWLSWFNERWTVEVQFTRCWSRLASLLCKQELGGAAT
jgi:hypothetical protein